MKKNMMIISAVIILMLIISGVYIFSLKNDSKIENNSTNLHINKTNNLNQTLNNTNIDDENSSDKYEDSTKFIEKNKYVNKNNSNNTTFDGALMAKELVEKYVLKKNEIAGKPIYKDKYGDWLVPIFDKKTGKFVTSVFSGDDPMFLLFSMGPSSYAKYKDIVSGKSPSQSEINKRNRELGLKDIIEDSDSSDFYLLAKSNPDSVIVDEFSLDLNEPIILDSNPITPLDESNSKYNSTI